MRMRNRIALAVGAVCLAAGLAADSSSDRGINSLVGTWKLVSCESRSADGQVQLTYGADPVGVLIYDAGGNMSVHLMRRDRARFASEVMRAGTEAEVKSAFDSFLSYHGTYTVNAAEGSVSHHLQGCSYPNWTGTTQKRFMKLEGKRLTLTTQPLRMESAAVQLVVVWERVL